MMMTDNIKTWFISA